MNSSENMTTVRQKPKFSVAISTKAYQKLISDTLADPDRAGRFVASITSAVAVNSALQECDAGSVLAGGLLGESLGLSPSPQLGQYYLVPFKSKAKYDRQGNMIKPETITAQFVLGYKGYIQLALRSGNYADLDVMEIHEGEYLGRDPLTGKHRFSFIEDDDKREALPVIGYMAYFEYLNGFHKTLYWSRAKMEAHADKYSAAYSSKAHKRLLAGEVPEKEMWKYSSYWYKDFDGMAKKTMLRQLISKWGVMSIEFQKAIEQDGSMAAVAGGKLITAPEEQPDELPAADGPDAQPETNPDDKSKAATVNMDEI